MNEIENIMVEYQKLLDEIDEEWRRLSAIHGFKCDKCGTCCRTPVPVSRVLEAMLLVEAFERLDEAKRADVVRKARAYKQEAELRGYATYPSFSMIGAEIVLSQAFRDLQNITCPFLSKNLCEVYASRPLACRTYTCYDQYDWMPFHLQINELERHLPGARNWNTKFVADVLLIAEKE